MRRHLVLRLASPLIAFGGEAIDNLGVIRDFPALSMLTGLIANALGWDRGEAQKHDRLQQRLRMGCVLEPGAQRVQDFQTAQLAKDDKAWTTWGTPEERAGGAGTYAGPHLRYRDYHADLCAWVALALHPAEDTPTLDDIAAALDQPARPLFIGRKPCLPAGRLVAGWQSAADVRGALQAIVAEQAASDTSWNAQWPDGEGTQPGDRLLGICDERNWVSGMHGGWRPVRQAVLRRTEAAA
ncbi:type I-E CRISPR-associated protein Cas5/CasD [Alicycliphilus denitrificans]|uniref:type I-E CRISPR-associated protein Cas5/CasD n=1 Tax=Alicycliphilus denitrificans TaxID=179636 RepID=UPI0009623BE0|nr:type I-E CRISPR-associated protein Cas5/CasD [Alicycliphilus denitrificans]MBN9572682.1 type I-E CRISPR-associated protein Cas5/CasD [Alicycliphilus denitrificans]OJW92616.1 MAG: type I-E CRISPR-associated protein Cas5/CasD [Alicycliphilus sp. 69-12]BCN37269.1 type I-E CRISPR-associated protein Cas5/CasD [Alicycliphilus denitrificans]